MNDKNSLVQLLGLFDGVSSDGVQSLNQSGTKVRAQPVVQLKS